MAQAQSVATPTRVPLLADPQNRSDSTAKDARLVNCYYEIFKTPDGQTDYWIYKRPGLLEQSRPAAADAAGSGVYNWRGNIYSVFGNRVYKDGVVLAGTVNTAGGVYRFSSTLGSVPKLVLGNGVKAYYYSVTTGLVEIIDVDFPTAFVKGWAYLNGTTYVMRSDAGIQGSDINDPANWAADNVLIAQIEPDQGRALAKQLVYVIPLKEWSTEVFYDAANPSGSPLGRVEGAKANLGCVSADSVQDLDGILFWIGSARSAGIQVCELDQLKLIIISTPAVERLLQGADFTSVYSWQVVIDGHRFVGWTIVNENLTLVYDVDQNAWGQWTDADGDYFPIIAATYGPANQAILQHATNGRLYYASSSYYSDDDEVITVDIITPNWDAGVESRGKMVSQLSLVADKEPGSAVQVRVNDNDFAADGWSQWRPFDLGQRRPSLRDWGTFERRSHWLRHQSNTRLRVKALEIQLDIGTL